MNLNLVDKLHSDKFFNEIIKNASDDECKLITNVVENFVSAFENVLKICSKNIVDTHNLITSRSI